MAFVVACRARSFVVHHQFYTFRMSVFVERFKVEVGVRSYKIEHIVFFVTEPVFPTCIPPFYKYLMKPCLAAKSMYLRTFSLVAP